MVDVSICGELCKMFVVNVNQVSSMLNLLQLQGTEHEFDAVLPTLTINVNLKLMQCCGRSEMSA